jgi:hypothetical protein
LVFIKFGNKKGMRMLINYHHLTERGKSSKSRKTLLFVRAKLFILISFVCLIISSCVSVEDLTFQMGKKPNPSIMEKDLKVGESTQADVRREMGQPYSKGKAMLPVHPEPRIMWTYYFEGGKVSDFRRIFLFVYFKEDRLDGYMWFSSLPK